jgi:hypothetical protein
MKEVKYGKEGSWFFIERKLERGSRVNLKAFFGMNCYKENLVRISKVNFGKFQSSKNY